MMQRPLRINIILPFKPTKPGGGVRVMYEYANYLSSFGHRVTVYHSMNTRFLENKFRVVKYFYHKNIAGASPKWFNLLPSIDTRVVKEISNNTIEDGDIIFSTWWSLVYNINELSPAKGIRFNLIQDIEHWFGNEQEVQASYKFEKSNNVVIAKYLYDYVSKVTGKNPHKVSFAIDHNKYFIETPIGSRNKNSVIMLHSTEPRKGTAFGIQALNLLKAQFPDLSVKLFGVKKKPEDLPEWMEYNENPQNLNELYNSCALFLGPSNQEGCALPPMEAMHAGCAVVCTDIDGHKDYAFDNETALLARPQDAPDMAAKLALLIQDSAKLEAIATGGNQFIRKNTWEHSSRELEQVFFNSLD